MNSSDSLLYNFSYLSSVIHPVIILRLLEHRLFTPLFKKKAVTSNPPISTNPIQINENKNLISSITPNIGASAIASIPMLPKLDPLKRQRNSLTKEKDNSTNDRSSLLTKFTHSTYDKNRKISKTATPSTSISGITSINSQISTNSNLPTTSTSSSSGGANTNDLSLLLGSTISSPPTTNNPNQPRKWFWRNSDKNSQSSIPNDRNPLLQAIVETDTLTSTNNQSTSNPSSNVAGVGEIKLLEKELLNLPSFQLSDSQNPLLPSPTCLNYDFTTQFDSTNHPTTTNLLTNRQYSSSSSSSNIKGQQTNNLFKSKINDEDCKLRDKKKSSTIIKIHLLKFPSLLSIIILYFLAASSFTDNVGSNLLTTLNIPFVAVRTPSDDSNRSSSHNGSPSRHLSSSDNRQQRSLSNTRMSVRETVKSLFRSSKTVDNMSSTNTNVNNNSTNSSICNRNISKLKSSSPLRNTQLSHSQPIVTELLINDNNIHFESPLISHSEQTPLIDRRDQSKRSHTKTSFNNNNIRLNRDDLHLPLDIDGLHRSRSCTDGIIIPSNNQENDVLNGTSTVPSNLQANHSDGASLHSSDSTASSLSGYLSTQQPTTTQLSAPLQINGNGKNEINKSQESLFSFSSPVQKQRSLKSLIMSATTKDTVTKQGNDVLYLIANWVLRSPEDFQCKFY